MSLAGLGVLIIGLAFLLLALFLAKALNNLASVLDGVDRTVEQLPNQIDEVLKETSVLIRHSNDTIADVNEKLKGLSPLFYIIGDVGESSRKLSSSFMDISTSLKNKSAAVGDPVDHKYLSGLYSTAALGYYWLRKGKKLKNDSALYTEGNKHADKIKRLKKDVQEDVKQ
ncbi:general stress protein [Virgibacillus phasianinus]|uniref:General stress protein n=1 Tax=Virgibacillus phasianinus TaxID=2017483 RepID=A0A220TZX6_9BACI|nr:DUF948 domain-containing protein [Virgibacillus phasianinus]ASK61584.1 general stress protein [Virgibacillus phasianinus]